MAGPEFVLPKCYLLLSASFMLSFPWVSKTYLYIILRIILSSILIFWDIAYYKTRLTVSAGKKQIRKPYFQPCYSSAIYLQHSHLFIWRMMVVSLESRVPAIKWWLVWISVCLAFLYKAYLLCNHTLTSWHIIEV